MCTPTNFPTRLDPINNNFSTIDLTVASADLVHLIDISLGPATRDSDYTPIRISINLKLEFVFYLPPAWKFGHT